MTDRDNITLPREVAYQVPLHELLESVPLDARLVIDDVDGKGTRFIPVGRLCREAATALRTALAAEPVKPITVPKTVPLPPIICGFVDVRFDGEGWFCDKCGKRMSADFETSVRRGSGEKCYLELMQRKSEAVRAMSERNMK